MIDKTYQKKGLTTFGWLLVGGAAAFLLSSSKRRERAAGFVRGLAAKVRPAEGSPTPA